MLTDTGSVSGRRYAPREEFLIAVTVTAVPAWPFCLPVETIGGRFGGIPQSLPVPRAAGAVALAGLSALRHLSGGIALFDKSPVFFTVRSADAIQRQGA